MELHELGARRAEQHSYIENVLGDWSPEGDHWNDFSGAASGLPYLVEDQAPYPQLAATPLVFTPNPVAGGQSAAGQVSLTQPAPAGVRVSLTSDHPSVAAVPLSVTVPAGQTSAPFTVPYDPGVSDHPRGDHGGGADRQRLSHAERPVAAARRCRMWTARWSCRSTTRRMGTGIKKRSSATASSWQQARDVAASYSYAGMPGHLVTVTSQDEHNFLLAQLPNRTECWIGLYQDRTAPDYSEPAGGWRWITGEPYAWNDWRGEPNNANGDEDFAVMRGTAGWNDLSATSLRYGLSSSTKRPSPRPRRRRPWRRRQPRRRRSR